MYNEHFGLTQAPFRITPDTRLFFPGGDRGAVLDALVYAITSGEGIVKVVGEVGTGKTMLCRMLEERLPSHIDIVYLVNPSLSSEDILQAIALEMDLEVEAGAGRMQLMHRLQSKLLEKHAGNQQVVVFIEEAQAMPIATLEEVRLLSNLETKRDKLLQIVLFAQPELDKNLARAEIRQLKERITHGFYLRPLSKSEVHNYIQFRLGSVGYRGPDLIGKRAYTLLAKASRGLIRRVNILVDKTLLAAYADNTHNVTAKHVRIAVADSEFETAGDWRRAWRGAYAVPLALVLLAAGAALFLWRGGDQWRGLFDLPFRGEAKTQVSQRPVPATASQRVQPAAATAKLDRARATGAPDPLVARSGPPQPQVSTLALASEVPAPASTAGPSDQPPSGANSDGAAATAPPPDVYASDDLEANGGAPAPAPPPADVARRGTKPSAAPPARALAVAVAPVSMQEPKVESAPVVADSVEQVVPAAFAILPLAAATTRAPSQTPAVALERAAEDLSHAYTPTRMPSEQQETAPGATSTRFRLLEQRLAAASQWLSRTAGRRLSIQLMASEASQRQRLERFLNENSERLEHVYVYRTSIRGRPWFGVMYRDFGTVTEAREALQALPQSLRRHDPFIRNVSDIQAGS